MAKFNLRPYQSPVAGKVFHYIGNNPDSHPLVALPTGAGKTVVIADLIYQTLQKWPKVNVLVLSHVKEILEQNYKTLVDFFEDKGDSTKIGVFSSGLGRREVEKITVAGIQSVYKRSNLFSDYQLIIIDECHLINPKKQDTMYNKFISEVGAKCVGFTATPFRLGAGYIYGENRLFDDLIYDYTTLERFNGLIDDGYLCNLVVKQTSMELDTNNIRITAGDFNEKSMSLAFDKRTITEDAVKEMMRKGEDRKKWLIFAIDIRHAEHIAEFLISQGIPTNVVHSKMEFDREKVISDFKAGKYRALVNVNVLTTGFDDPEIDLICLLRPTQSPVLHVQTIGRGLRISPNKDNCLILDFAGNTKRLGPINNIDVKTPKEKKGTGEPITKTCPSCLSIVHPSVRVCPDCGHEFVFKNKIEPKAGIQDVILRTGENVYEVNNVLYSIHSKRNSPKSIKVSYQCGLKVFNEWICVEHNGYAKHLANAWTKYRAGREFDSVEDFMENADFIKRPDKIKVSEKGRYPNIIKHYF